MEKPKKTEKNQKKTEKNRKKPVPNLKFAVAFGFFWVATPPFDQKIRYLTSDADRRINTWKMSIFLEFSNFVSNTIFALLLFTTAISFSSVGIFFFQKRQFHFHEEDKEFHEVEVVGVELLVLATLKITRKYRSSRMSENNQSCQSTILSHHESHSEDMEL